MQKGLADHSLWRTYVHSCSGLFGMANGHCSDHSIIGNWNLFLSHNNFNEVETLTKPNSSKVDGRPKVIGLMEWVWLVDLELDSYFVYLSEPQLGPFSLTRLYSGSQKLQSWDATEIFTFETYVIHSSF